MQQITSNLYLFQDTCNVYVIKNGTEAVLIDFGTGDVLAALKSIGVERVTDILMTHHHRDQGQGLSHLTAPPRLWVPHQEQELFQAVDAHWQGRELYNNYNNREDRFSLAEPVPVAGTLKDYATYHFGGHTYTVVPTPGHTPGSISLLAEIDTTQVAFTGDLIAGPGKVWSLAATQWSYNGGEGIPGSILSLLDLKERKLDFLLPSHGMVMEDPIPAIDLTVERLARLRDLRRQNPRLFLLRDKPYEAITPHLLMNRTSMANAYVLLSESGKALFIDFGYDFLFGLASGQDRAARRPWLYTLPALKRDFGVTKVDVVLPTHYHDDHVAGFNLLREAEGAEVWAPASFADVLTNPAAYNLPCLWYDPIGVDRVVPLGEPIHWEEYELTLYPLPGHTFYAVAIVFTVDGKKVIAAGDQEADGDQLFMNYVYKNGFRVQDYRETGELYQRIQPDLIISGHWAPYWVQPGYLDQVLERGIALEQMHEELLLVPDVGTYGIARVQPYQTEARAGETLAMTVTVKNPFPERQAAVVRLELPSGWTAAPGELHLDLDSGAEGQAVFQVTTPAGQRVRRARLMADVTVGTVRFGQVAEAVVTLK